MNLPKNFKDPDKVLKFILKEKYSLDISGKQLMVFVREYNQYKRTLLDCVLYLIEHPEELYNLIIERSDIPLQGERNNKSPDPDSKTQIRKREWLERNKQK